MLNASPVFVLCALLGGLPGDCRQSPEKVITTMGRNSDLFEPQSATSEGVVVVEGRRVEYQAVAGTMIVHGTGDLEHEPMVSMFYVAYTRKGVEAEQRPITFLFNGGPGSSTLWLHMGGFGPRRVQTVDGKPTPAAPYTLSNNEFSLLDRSDLVFIDAPETGFSRILATEKDDAKRAQQMKDRRKAIFGIDGDAVVFARFITGYLSEHGRWNSPKYLFGESYGTTRGAVLANLLENGASVDLNGVIFLSQYLCADNDNDSVASNPGMDMPYILALPTFAATAWYHRKLSPQPAELIPFLREVEQYAQGEYAAALMAGAELDDARRQAVAERLHQYTGLPVPYLLKADLRVSSPMFEKALQDEDGLTTGRLDTRFSGPAVDPLGKEAQYDPQGMALNNAYVAAFNEYVRRQLKFGEGLDYRASVEVERWDLAHKVSGAPADPLSQMWQPALNVMPDLAMVMKTHPGLKVLVNGGYFDLSTPYFGAIQEMRHLPVPRELQKNISFAWYQSGHMVYVNPDALHQLHDNVAAFIDATCHVK